MQTTPTPAVLIARLAMIVTLSGAACSSTPGSRPAASPVQRTVDVLAVGVRAAHTANTLPDGTVFVAGGCVTDGCTTATVDTYVIASDGATAWAGPPMGTPRDSHTASVLDDGRVVLVGGFPGEGAGVSGSIEIVDPGVGTIDELTLAMARGGHGAALVGTDQVLVVGGWVRPRTYTATVELIDASAGRVTAGRDLPWAADGLDVVSLADGRVLATGGQIAPDTPTRSAAVYDPSTGTWTEVGPMIQPRLKHFSVQLPDGRVLVMGGDIGQGAITATTEVFDPATGEFRPGPDMAEPRYKLPQGALAIGGSRVLVAAGGTGAEVVDVATGRQQVVDRTLPSGWFTTLSRLGNGDFVVVGGYDDRIDLLQAVTVIPASSVGSE